MPGFQKHQLKLAVFFTEFFVLFHFFAIDMHQNRSIFNTMRPLSLSSNFGRCYPTSESVSQPPSDPRQSEWSETEPEGESEEADEHDEERSLSIDRDNDTHLLL